MISTKYFDELRIKCKIYHHSTIGSHNEGFLKSMGFSPCEVGCINGNTKPNPLKTQTGARKVLKTCKSCERDKKKSEFGPRKNSKDGLEYWCLKCRAKYRREYNNNKKDKVNKYARSYRGNNKDKVSETQKTYHYKNKDTLNEKSKSRYYKKKEEEFNDILKQRL